MSEARIPTPKELIDLQKARIPQGGDIRNTIIRRLKYSTTHCVVIKPGEITLTELLPLKNELEKLGYRVIGDQCRCHGIGGTIIATPNCLNHMSIQILWGDKLAYPQPIKFGGAEYGLLIGLVFALWYYSK